MANFLNQVHLLGNVGNDPEIKTTKKGTEFVSFNLCTQDSQENKMWHQVVVYNSNFLNYAKAIVKKGARLMIVGEIRYSSWESEDGKKHYRTEIIINSASHQMIPLSAQS